MSPERFSELAAQGYNRIPVSRRVLADMDTPLSAYLKLADGPYSYLFESVQGGEKWGRYSIIGLPCRTVLKVHGFQVSLETDGDVVETFEHEDPLEFVKQFQARFRVPKLGDHPRFNGGLVGYFGYDTVRYIEPRLRDSVPPDTIGSPMWQRPEPTPLSPDRLFLVAMIMRKPLPPCAMLSLRSSKENGVLNESRTFFRVSRSRI